MIPVDISILFADFGVDALVNGAVVRGIFTEAGVLTKIAGVLVEHDNPTFAVAAIDAPNIKTEDMLIINNAHYKMLWKLPGAVLTTLELERL